MKSPQKRAEEFLPPIDPSEFESEEEYNAHVRTREATLKVVSKLFEKVVIPAEERTNELEAARKAYASEFDGDVSSIHKNIRKLKKDKEVLLEAGRAWRYAWSECNGTEEERRDARIKAGDLTWNALRYVEKGK